MNLELSGLRRSPRIAALQNAANANNSGPDIVASSVSTKQSRLRRSNKPRLSFLSVFNSVGSYWTFATQDPSLDNDRFSYEAQILNDLDCLNGLFDDTINDICHHIQAFTMSDNELYTYSQMLQQDDHKDFFQAMEVELNDHETRNHWTLMK